MSVSTLTTQDYCCGITHKESRIWNASRELVILMIALSPSNNLCWFQSNQITPMGSIISSLAQDDFYHLWHHHFGHLSRDVLHQAASRVSGMPTIVVPPSLAPCKGCALEKMHDCPYASLDKQATRPLALVHTDVVGPMPVKPCLWYHYILTFIDDFSGYCYGCIPFPLLFLLFPSHSMCICPFYGLSCFSSCSNYLIAQTLPYLPFNMTNRNVPLV